MNAPTYWNSEDREFQRQLSARLVGDDFSALPGISAFGALARTARLNGIEREHYFSSYGLRLLRTDDVSQVLASSRAQKDRLALTLGVRGAQRRDWDFESWSPFTGAFDTGSARWELKLCPCCARIGYHSLAFQLPWVNRCAWHGCTLITRCERCERPLGESLTDGLPLQCTCGRDYFVWREACQWKPMHWQRAPTFLAAYRDWANSRRSMWELISPNLPHTASWDALAALVSLPPALADAWGTTSTDRVVTQRQVMFRDTAGNVGDITAMAVDMPVTTGGAIDLPASLIKPCQAVSRDLAIKLPPSALTLSEWDCFLQTSGIKSDVPGAATRRTLADVLFLPVLVAGKRAILDVTSISKIVREIIERTASAISPTPDTARWVAPAPPRDIASVGVLFRIVRLLLLRGYPSRQLGVERLSSLSRTHRRHTPSRRQAPFCANTRQHLH